MIRYTCYTIAVAIHLAEPSDRGAALFNNRHLVAVVQAIGSNGTVEFTTRQLAHRCGLADSVVRGVLQRLLGSGLIHEYERRGGVRGELLYRVRDGAGWELLVPLCRQLTS